MVRPSAARVAMLDHLARHDTKRDVGACTLRRWLQPLVLSHHSSRRVERLDARQLHEAAVLRLVRVGARPARLGLRLGLRRTSACELQDRNSCLHHSRFRGSPRFRIYL